MIDISKENLDYIESILNSTISNLLNGGTSDPGWGQLNGAAACFQTLEILGLKIRNKEDVRITLIGENILGEDFLNGEDF